MPAFFQISSGKRREIRKKEYKGYGKPRTKRDRALKSKRLL